MNQTTQINVSMPNEPGSLLAVCSTLQKASINIEAIFCTEGANDSTVHIIVDNIPKALEVLQSIGTVSQTEVFTFEMQNKPGAIASIASMCSAADINIRNVYATTDGEKAMVYVSVSDPEAYRNLYQSSVEC